MDVCLRVPTQSNKSRFDTYSRQEQCIDHIPYYLFSRAHFFPTTFSNSCLRPFDRPLVLYLRGLFWCLLDLSGMSFLREGKTGFKKACLSIYVVSQRAFIYGSGVCKFRRHVCKNFPEPTILSSVVSRKYTFVSSPPSRTGHGMS